METYCGINLNGEKELEQKGRLDAKKFCILCMTEGMGEPLLKHEREKLNEFFNNLDTLNDLFRDLGFDEDTAEKLENKVVDYIESQVECEMKRARTTRGV